MPGHPDRDSKGQSVAGWWRILAYGAMLLLALLALTEIAAV